MRPVRRKNQQRAVFIETHGTSDDQLVFKSDGNIPADHGRMGKPSAANWFKAGIHEISIPFRQIFIHPNYEIVAGHVRPCLDSKRRGNVAYIFWQFVLAEVDIDSNAQNDKINFGSGQFHLGQNTANLFPPDENIVGPFEIDPSRAERIQGLDKSHAGRNRDLPSTRRLKGRTQNHRGIDVRSRRRMPDAMHSAFSGGLTFSDKRRAMRGARLGDTKRLVIG